VEMLSAFCSPVLGNWLFASCSLLLRIAALRRYGWSPIVVPAYFREKNIIYLAPITLVPADECFYYWKKNLA
jgi:hypothetical protein